MSEHTPRPWSCTYYECPDQWAIYEGSGGNQLAIVYDKANAQFIAAAPETAAERDGLKAANIKITQIAEGLDIRIGSFHYERNKLHEEITSLKAINAELLYACNALLGLLQLISARDDISSELREVLETNHRVEEAYAAIAKHKGGGS